jgi:hypothetical protein
MEQKGREDENPSNLINFSPMSRISSMIKSYKTPEILSPKVEIRNSKLE